MISTSDKKREEALGHLGAQHFLISKDEAAMKVRGSPYPTHVSSHDCVSQRGHMASQMAGLEAVGRAVETCRYSVPSLHRVSSSRRLSRDPLHMLRVTRMRCRAHLSANEAHKPSPGVTN